MAQYVYSISTDTLNGVVAASALDKQIRADTSVPIELVGVTVLGDILTIEFQASLDAGQQTALTAVVAAHDGVALPKLDLARRSDGVLRVVQEPSNYTNLMQIKGFGFTATGPANQGEVPKVTEYDIDLTQMLDIQGIHSLWVVGGNQHEDDFVSVLLIFPAGESLATWTALELGAENWPFGAMSHAPSDVLLKTFADQVFIPAGGLPPVLADGTQTLTPPLKLRVTYSSNGILQDQKIRGNLRWWLFS